jgi:hypothetical protein
LAEYILQLFHDDMIIMKQIIIFVAEANKGLLNEIIKTEEGKENEPFQIFTFNNFKMCKLILLKFYSLSLPTYSLNSRILH